MTPRTWRFRYQYLGKGTYLVSEYTGPPLARIFTTAPIAMSQDPGKWRVAGTPGTHDSMDEAAQAAMGSVAAREDLVEWTTSKLCRRRTS